VTGAGDDPRRPGFEHATHVYLAHVRIQHRWLDPLGHGDNAAYLNVLEQPAIDHAAVARYDVERLRAIGDLFIARRHEIDDLRPATAGDRLRILTWALELRAARAVRAYEIHRLRPGSATTPLPADILLAPETLPSPPGGPLVRARTEWAIINHVSGRPRRIPTALAAAFVRPWPHEIPSKPRPAAPPPAVPPPHRPYGRVLCPPLIRRATPQATGRQRSSLGGFAMHHGRPAVYGRTRGPPLPRYPFHLCPANPRSQALGAGAGGEGETRPKRDPPAMDFP